MNVILFQETTCHPVPGDALFALPSSLEWDSLFKSLHSLLCLHVITWILQTKSHKKANYLARESKIALTTLQESRV